MAQAGFWDNRVEAQAQLAEMKRAKATTEPVAGLHEKLEDLKALGELLQEEESEEAAEELEEELSAFAASLERVESKAMLAGEDDHRNAFLSIHAGAGGTESCDWVEMLNRMYTRWMDNNNYEWEVVDLLHGEEAGIKRTTLRVTGAFSYGYLKAEIGVHRLVRISPFDAGKRRHTSFASVDCVPELEDEETEIDPKDLQIDTYRSSGPGGQHVNKTDSAVRITHVPTGIVVQCQNERSQHKNRRMAMSMLRGKLHQMAVREREEQLARQRGKKTEIAWGNQIRSYVLHPYTMVKDHRTGVETSNAQNVLDGDITELIEAYLKKQIGGNDERK
jgi:peptide chain release factor 2